GPRSDRTVLVDSGVFRRAAADLRRAGIAQVRSLSLHRVDGGGVSDLLGGPDVATRAYEVGDTFEGVPRRHLQRPRRVTPLRGKTNGPLEGTVVEEGLLRALRGVPPLRRPGGAAHARAAAVDAPAGTRGLEPRARATWKSVAGRGGEHRQEGPRRAAERARRASRRPLTSGGARGNHVRASR